MTITVLLKSQAEAHSCLARPARRPESKPSLTFSSWYICPKKLPILTSSKMPSPWYRPRPLHVPPLSILPHPFLTPLHLPHAPGLNPLSHPQLPKTPLPHRPNSPNTHTSRQGRRRQHERRPTDHTTKRACPDRCNNGSHECVFSIPHDSPEDEDADVAEGAEEGSGAEPRWTRSGG